MRVAVDLRSLMETKGKISGVENYLINLFANLKSDNSIEVLPFYNSAKEPNFPAGMDLRGLQGSRWPNKVFNSALTVLDNPKFEKLYGDFDVLWMPDLRPFAIRDKTKFSLTVHDLSPVIHPELYSLKRRIWHSMINYRKSFARADLIFAVSEYTKYDLVKFFGLPPEKIKVVYPGINHHIFKPELDQRIKAKVAHKYILPEKFILSVSTIEPRKNILGLIAAFEQIQDSETHLVIAGRLGWLYSDILEKITNSPKKDRIKMLGYIDEQDKPYLMQLARIVCYPSFYEGFGFVPLEAMACGTPVITSARTSIPEICGDAALLIEPYQQTDLVDALAQALDDPDLRGQLIEKGFKRAKLFDWEKSARQTAEYLKALY